MYCIMLRSARILNYFTAKLLIYFVMIFKSNLTKNSLTKYHCAAAAAATATAAAAVAANAAAAANAADAAAASTLDDFKILPYCRPLIL